MDKGPALYTSSTGFSIEVRTGLIINEKVDIILNTTTQNIDLTGSPLESCVRTDGISRAQLDNIRHECERKAPEGLEMGEYVVSGTDEDSGNRYIYHGCVMDGNGEIIIQEYLGFIEECFEASMCMGFHTLALPLVSMNRYSQPNAADEKTFAVSLLDRCIATFADKRDFCNIRLVLVDMKNNVLNRTYANVLISHKTQTNLKSGASTKRTGSQPSSPTSPVQSQKNFKNWTQSLGPGNSGGAIPKVLCRTNSTGSSRDLDLNTTQVFSVRHGRNGSAQGRPASSSNITSYGKTGNDSARSSNALNMSHGQNENEIPIVRARNGGRNSANDRPGSSPSNEKNTSQWQLDNRQGGASSVGYGNDLVIKVYKGDITNADVQTVVHGTLSIYSDVDLGGAVGSALKKAGGRDFEEVCKRLGDYSEKRIVVTDAGRMKFVKIIHINTNMCKNDNDWQKIIKSCLEKADMKQLKSIAFPALGAAKVAGQTQATNFKAVLDEYKVAKPMYLEEIHFVIHDDTLCDTYEKVILGKASSNVDTFPSRRGSASSSRSPATNNPSPAYTSNLFSRKYRGVNIEVIEGDITNENVDCMVHGYIVLANVYTGITLDDPVGKAINDKAGALFKGECYRTQLARGQIEVTSGGTLCNFVIHADILEYSHAREPTWTTFVRSCLGKAKDNKVKSIAFPLINSRIGKLEDLAYLQIAGIKASLDEVVGSLLSIRFVIHHNPDAFKLFNEAADKLLGHYQGAHSPIKPRPSPTVSAAVPTGQLLFATGTINTINIEIVEGDITQDNSEMIVHGTTNSTGGILFITKLGKAIADAGGSKFIRECNGKWVPSRSTTVTSAGDMKCKKVLHIDIFNITKEDKYGWKEVMKKAMNEAYHSKIKSLAFPPIGMGNATRQQKQTIITAFKEAIDDYNAKTYLNPKRIRFVIFNDAGLFQIFKNILLPATQTSMASGGRGTSSDITYRMDIKGKVKMEITNGDLTTETTDAIVHVTNSSINFIGQSGDAIKKAGGKKLEDACLKAYFHDNNKVTFTKPGNLLCKEVLHLDASSLRNEKTAQKPRILQERIYDCLVETNTKKYTSISFPALGTGAMKCDTKDVAKCFKTAIEKFCEKKKPSLTTVRIVILDDKIFKELTSIVKKL